MIRQKIPPALFLFVIAPVFGELFSGSSPLNEFISPVTFVTLALLYGCGAIIARELVVRWKKGWASLLLLGFAYGIYEEGLLVQSFFDPTWIDLGNLGVYGRVAGVNWVWAEHLTIFHALISIAASVAFVEGLYPERRAERWVTQRKWWVANWAGFIGIYLVWEAMTTYDPGVWKLLSWLAILGLVLLARVLPARLLPAVERNVPRPWRFGWAGFLGLFGQFFLIYQGSDNRAYPFPVVMLLIVAWDGLILWLILRWNGNGAAWDDRHRIVLVNGALSFFLVLGPLTAGGQYPVMYFSNPIFFILIWLAARWINQLERKRFVM